ncbi:hypothetical protein EDM56_18430 [Brevibacillus fluminis]|uniref:Uncharacterized protein n=1 Tax=Brevibacillus fluminis TaxID=511487 RepID=A0A3M8DD58_9BACL|nr:hypothetical protein EDM56_18430 [Brevibacillus fluminis]
MTLRLVKQFPNQRLAARNRHDERKACQLIEGDSVPIVRRGKGAGGEQCNHLVVGERNGLQLFGRTGDKTKMHRASRQPSLDLLVATFLHFQVDARIGGLKRMDETRKPACQNAGEAADDECTCV